MIRNPYRISHKIIMILSAADHKARNDPFQIETAVQSIFPFLVMHPSKLSTKKTLSILNNIFRSTYLGTVEVNRSKEVALFNPINFETIVKGLT